MKKINTEKVAEINYYLEFIQTNMKQQCQFMLNTPCVTFRYIGVSHFATPLNLYVEINQGKFSSVEKPFPTTGKIFPYILQTFI